jgi:hypothetical protein
MEVERKRWSLPLPVYGERVRVRGSAKLAKCGSNLGQSPPNPLFPLTSQKTFTPLFPTLPTSRIIRPIALTGDLVRTGYQGRVTVPGWSSAVGGWVMNP